MRITVIVAINKKIILGITFFLVFSFIYPINAETESPRKQMKDGISPKNIICKDELELVIRINGMPACVKPETADIMQERGMLLDTNTNKIKFRDYNSSSIKHVCSEFLHYRS